MQNPHQVVAARPASQLLVVAPPGCGKTELLALRAEHLITAGLIRPGRRILALTFSNRARDNLSNRLRKVLGVGRYRRYVSVQNFHGFATRVWQAHHKTLGIRGDLALPNKRWMPVTLGELSDDRDERDAADGFLRQVKSRPLTDEEVIAALVEAEDELALRAEQQLQAAGRLDYPDLLRHAERLLRFEPIARLYQAHFDAVLIDEMQDLSMQQLTIGLQACGRNRTFVGDPTQGIYTWAGAEPEQVLAKLGDLCGEPAELDVSYRSSPAVLEVVNAVSKDLGGVTLQAADEEKWPGGGIACAVEFATESEEAEWVADMALRLLKTYPEASVGVIARAGYRRKEVDHCLANSDGPPVYRWDLPIDNPEVVDLLKRAARGMGVGASVEEDLNELQQRANALVDAADVHTLDDIDLAIEELGSAAKDVGSVRGPLAQIRVLAGDGPIPAGIHLLNAHVGKGQQFDWVLIVGLEEGNVPYYKNTTGKKLQEEERVLLVMLSRARHGLIISRARTCVTKYGTQKTKQPSRWWAVAKNACTTSVDELNSLLA